MFRKLWVLPIAVLLLGSTAQTARADWLFTPYLGAAFGGDTTSEQITYGGSAAFLGAGIFGVEFDAGITPDFYGDDTPSISDSNVTTVMAPTTRNGSSPRATASGRSASGTSCERSCSQAK